MRLFSHLFSNYFTQDFEETLASIPEFKENKENQMKNLIELKKKEIQASQDAYILKQMAVQIERGCRRGVDGQLRIRNYRNRFSSR